MRAEPLILVVDDEPAIRRVVGAALAARSYRVLSAPNGATALELAATESPNVVVLDLGLPDIDGIEVCARLRAWSSVPIIVLSADGADDRKISALDAGADDYVIKPFSTPELLARVRVALRHAGTPAGASTGNENPSTDAVHVVGDLSVDVAHHRVVVAGRKVTLTPKEFGFLALLSRHPGRVLTHRAILQEVWGKEYGTETQYLRVYASQLRRKLSDDAAHPRLITEPGVGYRLVDPTTDDGL